ncbi:AMP-binding protein [Sphingobium sp. RSMS]|uniref:AMP-binding protein n=1 Tax=Sphingobium sp. RSMS TaxID=520734 RepID=UPI0014859D89|nr:AMP-binding protein [Sphingobium sp. RSMS]UXC89773.1 AMP-binding protein [Sphingobium sp. RSMS]
MSNLPAVFLMSDFGCPRLNNAAVSRSDHFIDTVIEGNRPLAEFETMRRYLDLPEDDGNDSHRFLLENYRETAGLTEIDRTNPSLYENLIARRFDLILMDNLSDGYNRLFLTDVHGQETRFHFPIDLAGPNCQIWDQIRRFEHREVPCMSAEQSASNWLRIIDWVKEIHPDTPIIFSLPFSCTSEDAPERKAFFDEFNAIFPAAVADRGIALLPSLNPDRSLWKLPDWKHFDMRIYKGIAGLHFTQMQSGWKELALGAGQAIKKEVRLMPWRPLPGLRSLLANTLAVSEAAITEESCVDRTENWDSLKQVEVMTAIEAAYGIQATFDEAMEANSVSAIRQVLAQRGIAAADDEAAVSNIFHDVVNRAYAAPDALYGRFIKEGAKHDISYGDMLRQIAAVHHALAGVPSGGIVAIVLGHSPHIYSGFIGSVLGGWVPTMLPPLTRKQDPEVFRKEIGVLFGRVQPAAVITSGVYAGLIPSDTGAQIILVEALQDLSYTQAKNILGSTTPLQQKGALAFLQHSSGTTGHKKGVMLTHDQVYHQARTYAQAIKMQTGDVVASWLPLYHDMGLLTSFIIPTIIGCPIISMDALEWVANPTMLLDEIEEEKAAYCWMPNFAFHHVARAGDRNRTWDLSSIKAIISCSEPCRAAAFTEFSGRFASMGVDITKLGTSYAMAENVFAVTQSRIGKPVSKAAGEIDSYLSSGPPLSDVQVEIRIDGQPQSEGVMGAIWLRSPSMFSGYLNLPELTRERIVDGWYDTKDLGMMQDGELTVVGRTDDLIIISGKNVVAHELEDQLNAVPGIAPGRVLVASNYDEASALTELIVLAEPVEDGVDAGHVEAAIRDLTFTLSGVSPRKVRLLPRGFLIKSTSGKISRSKSLEKFNAQFEISKAV